MAPVDRNAEPSVRRPPSSETDENAATAFGGELLVDLSDFPCDFDAASGVETVGIDIDEVVDLLEDAVSHRLIRGDEDPVGVHVRGRYLHGFPAYYHRTDLQEIELCGALIPGAADIEGELDFHVGAEACLAELQKVDEDFRERRYAVLENVRERDDAGSLHGEGVSNAPVVS